jgi:arginase
MDACHWAAAGGDVVLALGGDHSMSVGTVAAQVGHHGDNLGVIWVDSHADINTADTSTTGNTHGMTLGRLLGLESHWLPILRPHQIVYVGLCSVDPPERHFLADLGIRYVSATEVASASPGDVADFVAEVVGDFDNIHISFDVDVAAKGGTGTPVPGSMSEDDATCIARALGETFQGRITGVDCVELNVRDFPNTETVHFARNFIWNLFPERS